MQWKRTPDRKAGPGNLLNGRWLVRSIGSGASGMWEILDQANGERYPSDRPDAYYSTMKGARQTAEYLALLAQQEEESDERS